jgi:uncharacterized protein (DUF1697 family)
MQSYVILIRGVNVGGKSAVSMATLKTLLEAAGYLHVATYINSGNILLDSLKKPTDIQHDVEHILTSHFGITDSRVLVLSRAQLQAVVDNKPGGFGDQPERYYSDAIFLMGITATDALPIFRPREGVDVIWPGTGVIYSQRLGAERTKSRLNKIISSPLYKSMTIRNWNTTTKLLALLRARV